MTSLYFRHTKTNRRFKVLRHNKETNELTLKGSYSEFKVKFDKDWLKEMGYTVERVDEDEPVKETEDA
jgi:hypothetical protein